ncbi:DUF202 domain-containing protein [Lujinxingia sediminis]|uniref:DUF202 domain-containing protein n=1 Tax=Lujinxingia sediminis TaxID=2480984 RepID=A0ABY0CQN9_9DELT|nr:DUF202 domain-containing protein [Lujinxingia sediminis]RVU42506.1 DUF202 domain-containing protein [Lujinxingia sediminis]
MKSEDQIEAMDDPPENGAEKRTDYAYERTVQASSRTLMAGSRTSIAMIAFGFTIFKFFGYLEQGQSEILGEVPSRGPANAGLLLFGVGMTVLLLSVVDYVRDMYRLSGREGERFPYTASLVGAVLLLVLAGLVLVNLLTEVGPL